MSAEKASLIPTVWKWNVDGSNPEKFVDNCGYVYDVDPGGQYLLGVVPYGEKTGIYEVSISDRKCIPLLPGAVTLKWLFLLATASRSCMRLLLAVKSRFTVSLGKTAKPSGRPRSH